ncbi:MAG: hypothetical protein AAAB35_23070 [Phyllobacterium sp.]|uniref:hypothetical protein n=1 Tax=Phyllobacterium sp. TaxID=1871046 RepID=UPI0030F24E8C
MRKLDITRTAIWGAVFGCLLMAIWILYMGRERSVPASGYLVDLLGGAVLGAGLLSLIAWLVNLAMRPKQD